MSTDYRAHPEPEDLTDEAILKTAAKELGYEFTDSWFLTGRNSLPLEAEPLELLNFARAILARYGRPAVAPVTQPEPEGVTNEGLGELIQNLRIVCPYCGHIPNDTWDIDFDFGESAKVTCGECDMDYTVIEHVRYSYTTRKT